ncbi:MAG: cyclic nucleotide-binding domain-containing protein [Sulfuricaulis sp.]
MNTIVTFPNLIGFYVLTPEGQLGYFNQEKEFIADDKLTQTFADYNGHLLMSYLRNPEQGSFRLAIIHRTQDERPWGSYTLLLEKHIVRRLYPVAGMTTELDLTAFQKKNREKSIYRGMELFLEYKDNATPDLPVYCPVLYDRSTTIDNYTLSSECSVTSKNRDTPVVEVINMLAAIPIAKRVSPGIAVLKEKIYDAIVKKGMRKSNAYTLVDDVRRGSQSKTPGVIGNNITNPYGDVDKRFERQVTVDSQMSDAENGISGSGNSDGNLINSIGSILIGKPEPVDPMLLKRFIKFRELGFEKLQVFATQCLVYKVPPGTQLLARGTSDTSNLYLLEGTVQLAAADGGEKRIDSGTAAASNPISFLKPRMYTVTTVTRVAFLWIDDNMVEEIVQCKTPPVLRDGTA